MHHLDLICVLQNIAAQCRYSLEILKNLYLQHKLGMVSDEIWQIRPALLDAIVLSPGYERFHKTSSAQTFDGAFRHYASEFRANQASGGS